ncbi:hypothetical protein HDV57DRAFT_505529 [Trichoderma longibrachiatum]|uniref:Uncharacterized protein n=1 Tax=Trichoderma longibrachiatum ATCC 18648 TaxID=983965 RepID=A0A2T4BTZ6_TRILO|nr:hypothetical protein M440DRAFT_1083850 [Trichoderma longibrachiatum ATCC 18648]
MAPASLMTLPNELLYKICESFCPHCTHAPRAFSGVGKHRPLLVDGRSALSYVSKTCRRLREIAQPVLYHYVYTTRNWHVLRSIIARPDLAAHVRGLEYLGHTDNHSLQDLDIVTATRDHKQLQENKVAIHPTCTRLAGQPHVLELISTRLPNAEELRINMSKMRGWDFMVDLKSIRRLRLYIDSYYVPSHRLHLASFLSVMPRLECLRISGDTSLQSTHLFPTEIRTLDLDFSEWHPSSLIPVIDCCPKLERFRYYGVPQSHPEGLTWPRTQHIVYSRKTTLKHVNFSWQPGREPCQGNLRSELGSFRSLDGLETLWMEVGCAIPKRWKSWVTRFPANTTELIELLPESLRLIYFRGLSRGWHGIEMLALAIRRGHFPRLKTVVVQQAGATLRKSRKVLAAVGVACESISGASENGRHLFPEGGFWQT